MQASRRSRFSSVRLLGVAIVAAIGITACGDDSTPSAASTAGTTGATEDAATATGAATELPAAELSLVAYSTPQAAYEQIIEAFQATDRRARTSPSPSRTARPGDQSRAVVAGLTADYVAFSLEPDITRLVNEGLVAADWNTDQYKGIVTDSVVVIVVRKGNPKNINGWADLTKPGVEVITPNPFTSGGARWNIMAGYGADHQRRGTEAEASPTCNDLFKNVPVQDDSARKALQTFTVGKGDVLLSYENEAIFAQQNGQDIDYIVPDSTILIENPVAVTTSTKHPEQAKAFLDYVLHAPRPRRSSPRTATARWSPASRARTTSRRRPACSPSTTSVAGPR